MYRSVGTLTRVAAIHTPHCSVGLIASGTQDFIRMHDADEFVVRCVCQLYTKPPGAGGVSRTFAYDTCARPQKFFGITASPGLLTKVRNLCRACGRYE